MSVLVGSAPGSSATLAALCDVFDEPVWWLDERLQAVGANTAFHRDLADELYPLPLPGRRLDELLIATSDHETWRSACDAALAGHRQTLWQAFASSGGKPVPLAVAQLHYADGTAGVIIRAELERAPRARLAAVLTAAVDAIIAIDERGNIDSVNAAARAMFGYDDDEVVGNNVRMLMPPPYHDEHDSYLQHYLATGERRIIGIGREVVGRRKDGSTFPIELAVSEVQLGARRQFVGIARDITDRKRAELALRTSEERYRDLFENAHDMIQSVDSEGRFQYVNRAWLTTLGYLAHEVPSLSLGDVVAQESASHCAALFRQVAAKVDVGRVEARFRRRDGTLIDVEGTVNAFFQDGALIGTRGIFRDVTERRAIDRMKNEFISVVSHELRTPLTSIRGALSLLEGGVGGALPPKAADLIRIAHQNTNRLIRLINDMLDLEKIEAGRMTLSLDTVSAGQLVDTAVAEIRALAHQAGVIVAPHVDTSRTFQADRDRIVQVITNLVSNAIKFSSTGSVVEVSAEDTELSTVRFSVRDQGPGIEAEQLPNLFQKFRQLDASDSRSKSGTGLGLAISKAIVEQHSGTIGVRSAPGQGSVFFFDLPAPTGLAAVQPPQPAPATSLPGRRILIVEDDVDLALVLSAQLQADGHAVAMAHSIAALRSTLDRFVPDIVLLDMGLPDGTGLDAVQELRRRDATRHTPVVVLSGQAVDTAELAEPFFVDWLRKPFTQLDLKEALRRRTPVTPTSVALVVDDDADARRVIAETLGQLGLHCIEAGDGASAVALAATYKVDLIVLDVGMPGMDGFQVVRMMRESGVAAPLLVYTGKDLGPEERHTLTLGPSRHLTKSRDSDRDFIRAVRELVQSLPALDRGSA